MASGQHCDALHRTTRPDVNEEQWKHEAAAHLRWLDDEAIDGRRGSASCFGSFQQQHLVLQRGLLPAADQHHLHHKFAAHREGIGCDHAERV